MYEIERVGVEGKRFTKIMQLFLSNLLQAVIFTINEQLGGMT